MFKNTIDDFCNLVKQSTKNVKAIDPHKRLYFLNNLIDFQIGRALQVLEGAKYIKKCSIAFIGTTHSDGTSDLNQHYGHLLLDDEKYYRVSTCLNKNMMTIQIPAYERKYWDENTYLFFTTGDLFLTVKALDLDSCMHIQTDLNNLEYYILEMLHRHVIRSFGIIDDVNNMKSTIVDYDLKKVKMLKNFYNFNIKGCLSSLRPKYALKYAHSNDVEYYASLEGIRKVYPTLNYSRQYLARIAKHNFENKEFEHPKLITIEGIEFAIYRINSLGESPVTEFVKMLPSSEIYEDYFKSELYDDTIELSVKEAEEFLKSISEKPLVLAEKNILHIKTLFGRLTQESCNEALQLGQLYYYDKS